MTSRIPALLTAQFPSKEDAEEYVNDHGRKHGYGVAIKHSDPPKNQFYYCCDRGSYQTNRKKPLTSVSDDRRKRQAGFHQTQCRYEVFIRYRKRDGAWVVSDKNSHNHDPSTEVEAHAVHRRLNSEEREFVANNLDAKPLDILHKLKQRNPNNVSIVKDIRNEIAKVKQNRLEGLTHVEAAVEKLKTLGM